MHITSARFPAMAHIAVLTLLWSTLSPAQQPEPPRYKLTVIESASTSKRVKKGRVSSQAVVKLTDQNDVPVAGIAVAFTIPGLTGGGAAFANGALTTLVTTNAAGIASSGSLTAAAGTSFSVSAAASVPGGVAVTASVPITTSAVAAAAGLSTGAIVGIVAGVGAAAAAGIVAGIKASGGGPSGTISAPGAPTFGKP